jgi:hypothetical protein
VEAQTMYCRVWRCSTTRSHRGLMKIEEQPSPQSRGPRKARAAKRHPPGRTAGSTAAPQQASPRASANRCQMVPAGARRCQYCNLLPSHKLVSPISLGRRPRTRPPRAINTAALVSRPRWLWTPRCRVKCPKVVDEARNQPRCRALHVGGQGRSVPGTWYARWGWQPGVAR